MGADPSQPKSVASNRGRASLGSGFSQCSAQSGELVRRMLHNILPVVHAQSTQEHPNESQAPDSPIREGVRRGIIGVLAAAADTAGNMPIINAVDLYEARQPNSQLTTWRQVMQAFTQHQNGGPIGFSEIRRSTANSYVGTRGYYAGYGSSMFLEFFLNGTLERALSFLPDSKSRAREMELACLSGASVGLGFSGWSEMLKNQQLFRLRAGMHSLPYGQLVPQLYREYGAVRGLFRASSMTASREVAFFSMLTWVPDTLRQFLYGTFSDKEPPPFGSTVVPTALAGIVCSAVNTPFNALKTNMQFNPAKTRAELLRCMFPEGLSTRDKVRFLYRGFVPRSGSYAWGGLIIAAVRKWLDATIS